MLEPYRVLDLTQEHAGLCGKLLGDLGAEVIKVEPPNGDPMRRLGPFWKDQPHPDHSLAFWSYNTSKRSVTADLSSPEGRQMVFALARTADAMVESYPPGYMKDLGSGYEELRAVNPTIVMASITPFGQTGPYRDFKGTDLTAQAMGGMMCLNGDPDRAPTRISTPQAFLIGSGHAAGAIMVALHHRRLTGQGQHIDCSVHESIAGILPAELGYWHYAHTLIQRGGARRRRGKAYTRIIWPCRDGHVTWWIPMGRYGVQLGRFVDWMRQKGMAGELGGRADWDGIDTSKLSQEEWDRWEQLLGQFIARHTKWELYEFAMREGVFLTPVHTPSDVLADPHLQARRFWQPVAHPELGETLTYPGAPYQLSETPAQVRRRAPLLGEDTQWALRDLLGGAARAPVPATAAAHASKPPGQCNALQRRQALEGLKVLDLSWVAAGPITAKYLAELGTTVIRVESGLVPDITRVGMPYKDGVPGLDRATLFATLNSSKYGIAIDLKHPKAAGVVKRLAQWADVALEAFVPGVAAALSIDYQALRQANPRLIMLSISLQGQTGPHAPQGGVGFSAVSVAGFAHFTGWPDRDPAGTAYAYTDYLSPFHAIVSLLGALDYRDRTGKGQFIDLSQYEMGLTFLAPAVLDYTANGREQSRTGNRDPHMAPHGVYQCKGDDRWCAIAVSSDEEWRAFRSALGDPQWAAAPEFESVAGRLAQADRLDGLVEEWTKGMEPEEVMRRLQAAGVPAGVVQTTHDLLERDPQLASRGFFSSIEHPVIGPSLALGYPCKLSETPSRIRTAAPCMGEHAEYVCREVLRMDDAEFVSLVQDGVLQ